MRWGDAEYLQAQMLDELRGANWQRANVGVKRPGPQPDPVPRPGEKPRGNALGPAELKRRLKEMRARQQP